MTQLAAKVTWFGVIGIISTLVYGAVALAAVDLLSCSRLVANAAAFLVAMGNSYFGHRLLTFRSQVAHRHAMPRFAVQAAFGYAVSHAVTEAAARLGYSSLVGIVAVMLLLPAANFLVLQFWVFPARLSGAAGKRQEPPRNRIA